uniref:Ribosomal protein S16 n=1 Tax=Apophlaea sinclairii TaxID=212746 RepID=A0A1C9CBR2_9FLOR|nr:ribosomal protein S16 [Apophlaea sinclairii]AOM65833.1 ribosomal protein S16 [Apophlaea sinclairii]
MLKLRFKRIGRKKLPSYKIVVIDSKKRRDGRPLLELGFYNPITKKVKINSTMIMQKLKEGMKATKTMNRILQKLKATL